MRERRRETILEECQKIGEKKKTMMASSDLRQKINRRRGGEVSDDRPRSPIRNLLAREGPPVSSSVGEAPDTVRKRRRDSESDALGSLRQQLSEEGVEKKE